VEGGVGIGSTDEDLLFCSIMYWPDYNADGAFGVYVFGGDQIESDEITWGPAVEFKTGEIYDAILTEILPDAWAEALGELTVDVQPFAFGSVQFDYDFDPFAVLGTGFRIWPEKLVQPTIRTMFIDRSTSNEHPEMEGWFTLFSVSIFF